MKNWTKTTFVAGFATATFVTQAVSAQTTGGAQSRGVFVIRPGATPAAAPIATPVSTAAPTATQPQVASPAPSPVAISAPHSSVPAQGTPAPVIPECARPFAHPDVRLDHAPDFDRRLRRALLRHKASVVVDLSEPYPLDGTPPAQLTPWTSQAKLSGGVMRVDSYCQASRGMFGNFFKKLFTPGASPQSYEAAFGYDVVLHVNGFDRRVTQVEFASRVAR